MKEEVEGYTRQKYIDYLKVIAIIFIVFTHDPWSVENTGRPLFVLLIDMAVPIFMIVSGFNYAYSCRMKNKDTLKKLYDIVDLKNRILRFLIPFGIIYLGEVTLLVVFKQKPISVISFLRDMLTGGYGPGSYYTPVMIQFIFIVPLLYLLINRYKEVGLIIVFIINIVFECLYTCFNFSDAGYRLCVIRYLFLIAIGITWCEMMTKSRKLIIYVISFVIGFLYLVGTAYYYEPTIFIRWTTTSMMAGFYIFPIIILFVRIIGKKDFSTRVERIILLCSKSSFHIYLFQMVYYYVGVERIFYGLPIWLRLFFNIIICLVAGCIFYLVMTKILRRKRYYHE